ncbi:MAG: hypothetical protein NT107_07670 [Planctomycetota bacterium]|nr:hypothetical protein [Planctomycetota bacterium]
MDIAVFAGGRSPEHDISLNSAAQVLRHLDRQRWRPWPVFLDRDGGFWPAREALQAGETWQPGLARTSHGPLRPGAALDWLLDHARVQLVLPILHGPYGEDGTVQGMLELYDLPFVGSGCAASAVAMDKMLTRHVLAASNVPLAAAYSSSQQLGSSDLATAFASMSATVGLPAFVKIPCSGSSRGVQRITTFAQFEQFASEWGGHSRRWFAEASVVGEEITVAVLGNQGQLLQALPPVGIYPKFAAHFDERAKYEKGACDEIVPPRGLSTENIELAKQIAIRCHQALGCDGMSRTDMIWSKDGPIVLEVNTIPGLTEMSLLPKAAAAAGYSFAGLLDHLLELSLLRQGQPA